MRPVFLPINDDADLWSRRSVQVGSFVVNTGGCPEACNLHAHLISFKGIKRDHFLLVVKGTR